MRIVIRAEPELGIRVATLDIDPTAEVEHIITKLSLLNNTFDPHQVIITHNGAIVNENLTVMQAGIAEGDTVTIQPRSKKCCVVI